MLLHFSLSQKRSHCQDWTLRVENIPTAQPLWEHPSLPRTLWGDGAEDFPKSSSDSFHLGMDPRQNLRPTRPWISRSFCICVTAGVCLFLPFDNQRGCWTPTEEHLQRLVFPRKKQKSYRKERPQLKHPDPQWRLPHRYHVGREYTCRYQGGQKW